MSQSRTSWSPRAHRVWPILVLLAVGIGTLIYKLEQDRSERLVDESMHPQESLDGALLGMEFWTPVITPAHWRRIAGSESVRYVRLFGVETIKGDLTLLQTLPHLESLEWNLCEGVGDQHLETLVTLPALQHLVFRECPSVTDRSVSRLSNLKTLKTVELRGTSLSLDGLSRLRHARPDLTIKVHWTEDVPNTNLTVPDPSLDPNHLTLNSLEDLDDWMPILTLPHDWGSGTWLADPLEERTHLKLSGPAAIAALPELSSLLPGLERLVIIDTHQPSSQPQSNEQSSSNPLERLSAMPQLRSLELMRADFTEQDVAIISQLVPIETLRLRGRNSISDKKIAPLWESPNLPNLRQLFLPNAQLSPDCVERIKAAFPDAEVSVE